jgi:hypothetical protein
MSESRFVMIVVANLGRQGDYRVALCTYCGASAAVRAENATHAERVCRTFTTHHMHASAGLKSAA